MKRNIIIILLFLVAAFVVAFCFYGNEKSKIYKTYSTDDLSFDSNQALLEKSNSEYDVYFENLTGDVIVSGKKDSKTKLSSVNSLKEYSKFVYDNNKNNYFSDLMESEDKSYFYHTYQNKEDNVFYVRTFFENDISYFIIDFACQVSERKEYEKEFLKWANSIKIFNS